MDSLGALSDNTFLYCKSMPLCLQCVLKAFTGEAAGISAAEIQLLHFSY